MMGKAENAGRPALSTKLVDAAPENRVTHRA